MTVGADDVVLRSCWASHGHALRLLEAEARDQRGHFGSDTLLAQNGQRHSRREHRDKIKMLTTTLPKLCTGFILMLVVSITSSSLSAAQAVENRSARSLVQTCKAEQAAASGWCSAYLLGVADTLTAFGAGGHKGGLCGADYAIEDLPRVFLTWAQANPQFLNFDMLATASLALRQTWPCR